MVEHPNLPLFGKTIDARFEAFHRENPIVYRTLVRLAREALRHGKKRIGMKSLWERMRWHIWLETRGDEFRLNNDFTSRYARLIEQQESDLAGIFETRRLRAA